MWIIYLTNIIHIIYEYYVETCTFIVVSSVVAVLF